MSETTIEIKQRKCPECGDGIVSHNAKAHALGDFCLDCKACGLFWREDGTEFVRLEVGRKYLYVPTGGGMYTYKGKVGRLHKFHGGSGLELSLFGTDVMEWIVVDDTLELKGAIRILLDWIAAEGLGDDERYQAAKKLVS